MLDVIAPVLSSIHDRASMLRGFLEAYWLRPENALWMALRSEALNRVELQRPVADVSCGDGVFTFIHCGGLFDRSFDVFLAVDHLEHVKDRHADMFDGGVERYRPRIVRDPVQQVDVGTDCKAAMLTKAATLHLYRRLIKHDNNDALPLADGEIQTLYCNAAYWVREIDSFLSELARVVRPGGRIVLQVKLEGMRRFNLDGFRAVLGDRFLDIIGRGRLDCWPTLADRSTWERRFVRNHLEVVEAIPFVTRTHAHLWDVGLRPIAPLLVRMANALDSTTRGAIKRDWVDLLHELLMPFFHSSLDLMGDPEPAEIQYVLTPAVT